MTDNEIKSITLNFCELRQKSCEQCVENNNNSIYRTFCYWYNNTCISETQLDDTKPKIVLLEMCILKIDSSNQNKDINIISALSYNSTSLATTVDKLLGEMPKKLNEFIIISIIIAIVALIIGIFSGLCITRKHLFESFLYKRHKKFLTKLMLNDIKNIQKCVEKESDQEQLTVDLNKVSSQLCKVLKEKEKNKIGNKLNEKNLDSKNGLPLSVATFGISSMSSIDNSDSSSSPNSSKIISKESSIVNENILGGKHSRYINKNTDCYTIQNTYTNIKDLEQKAKIYDNTFNNGRTSSTSSNNSSNTSGILTSFTNSDTCLFKNENLNEANVKVKNEYLNNNYLETPKNSKLNKNNNNSYLTNMLQNYPKKSTITNKLFDYQNNDMPMYENTHKNSDSISSTTISTSPESISKIDERKKIEEKRQLKILNALLRSPSKNSYV